MGLSGHFGACNWLLNLSFHYTHSLDPRPAGKFNKECLRTHFDSADRLYLYLQGASQPLNRRVIGFPGYRNMNIQSAQGLET